MRRKKCNFTRTVRISNDWNKVVKTNLTLNERKFLSLIFSEVKRDEGIKQEIKIDREDFFKSFGWEERTINKQWTNKGLTTFAQNLNEKLQNLQSYDKETNTYKKVNIIKSIDVYEETERVYNEEWDYYDKVIHKGYKVKLGEDAKHYLFDIGEEHPYFKYNLKDCFEIDGTKALTLWEFYRQWRSIRKFRLTTNEVKIFFGMENYTTKNILRMIKGAMKTLEPYVYCFKLSYHKWGRNTDAYVFEFKSITQKRKDEEITSIAYNL